MEKRICAITNNEVEDKYTIRTEDGFYVLRDYYHKASMSLKEGLLTLKQIQEVNKLKIKLREAIQSLVLYIKKADLDKADEYLSNFMHKENLFNISHHQKTSECCSDIEHLEFIETFLEEAPENDVKLDYNESKDSQALISKYIKYNKIIL